jgi:large subunit ribosomal protein L32e
MTEQELAKTRRALRLRKRMRRKKPAFVRPESWRYVRLKESWRRPRGLDHKMRIEYAGWPPAVKAGYRGPKAARGFHPSGFKEVLVHNAEELENVDPKTHVARIAHTVGKRSRSKIMVEAKKKKITILNAKQAKEAQAEEEKELPEGQPEEEKEEDIKEIEEPKQKKRKTKKSKGGDEAQ